MSSNNNTKFVLNDCIDWHRTAEMEKKLGRKIPWKDLPRMRVIRSAHLKIVPGTNLEDAISDINRGQ